MRNYVFGGETGLTHEQLQGRRRVADQMLAANNRMPQNVGEGLHSIGRAIAGTILTKRNERREAELQDEANAQFNAVFGGGDFGAGGVASTGAPMSGFNPDAATPTSFTPSPTSGATPGFTDLINASLSRTESGGDHTARNAEGYTGEFQWGDARLADFNRANGTNFTLDQLHQDPALQQRAQDWHVNDIMTRAEGDGLMAFVGEDLNGPDVPGGVVTPGGIVAAAHLGGYGGMSRFIRSRGQHNPADSNGTSLMDYLDTHAMGGGASAQQPAPEPQQGRQASVAAIARAMGNPMIQQNPGRMAVLQALLGNALEGPETMSPYQQAQLGLAQSQETRAQAEFDQRMNATPERERIQDANGRWRYTDDSSLVFPDVEVQPEPGDRDMREDQNGVLRYVDTQEPVFPSVEEVAPSGADMTESERRLRIFQGMQANTSPALTMIEQNGFDPSNVQDRFANGVLGGNFFRTTEGQMYDAAAGAWGEAALRLATGAAATPEEYERIRGMYFAQAGDSIETIQFKAAMRTAYENNLTRILNGEIDGEIVSPLVFAVEQYYAQQNVEAGSGTASGQAARSDEDLLEMYR